MSSKDVPRRFRVRTRDGKHANGREAEWAYGVYFPATDLVVNDMGRLGTGEPAWDTLEWIDDKPKRHLTENGEEVSASDPQRLIWCSARCTFWTDDFNALGRTPGQFAIPCCPKCGCPGMQVSAAYWEKGVSEHDEVEPGYADFVASLREKCHGRGVTSSELWREKK